ncbi:MAG: hypothetical protein QXX34_03470 [Candidatus Bathyarchaeia archaeon]
MRKAIFPAIFLFLTLTITLLPISIVHAENLSDFTDTSAWTFYRNYWGTAGPWGYNSTHAYVQSSGWNWHGILFWSNLQYNVSAASIQVSAQLVNNGEQYDDNVVILLLTPDGPSIYNNNYDDAKFHDGIRLEVEAFRSNSGANATLLRRSSGSDTRIASITLSSYSVQLKMSIDTGTLTAQVYDGGTWRTVGSTSISNINAYIVLDAYTEATTAPTYISNFAASGLSSGSGGGGEPETLAQWLTWYTNEANWQSSIMTAYEGMIFNATDISDVVAKFNALTDPKEVLYWASVLKKYNVESQLESKIKWALDNMPMLSNGLPNTETDHFAVANRGVLYAGLYYSAKWNYATNRWNLNTAYNSFKSAVTAAGHPVLWVYSDGSTYTISYGPRYYDEAAQTIDTYLTFYDLGVSSALTDAINIWNWVNSNLWTGTYYKYAVNWNTYECEAGGFYQIIAKLWARYPNLPNIERLKTDINTRFLNSKWLSPQWASGGTSYHAVLHASENTQRRLQNTIMAWTSMLGVYNELDSTAKENIQALIGGYTGYPQPAWYYLTHNSGLYNSASYGWRWSSSDSGTDVSATTSAAALKLLLGMKPGTATIAIPLEEYQYEYILNAFDADLFQIDVGAQRLRLAIYSPGTVTFLYGTTPVTGTFSSSGIYTVQFSSDWNTIVSASKVGNLPSNRVYLGAVQLEPSPTPSSTPGSTSGDGLPGLVAILGVLIAFLAVVTAVKRRL